MSERIIERPRLSLKVKALATVGAVAGAVVLPQIFHMLGALTGVGTSLGEILLPMHFPILLAGLMAGSTVGAVSGLFAPLVSFALTGMPTAAMLPFMMIELCAYGLVAGLMRRSKTHNIVKLLVAQLSGRAVKLAVLFVAFLAFGAREVSLVATLTSVAIGLPGLLLQWSFIPLILSKLENK